MILTCPSCCARYLIASDTIGEAGRPVRCRKCKTEWFQRSEKDSLDDLISRVQSERVDIDFSDFSETSTWEGPAYTPVAPQLTPRGSSRLKILFEEGFGKVTSSKIYKKLLGLDRVFWQKIAGVMVGLACFMVLVFGLVLGSVRHAISERFPVIAPVYKAAGFFVELPEKEKLVFDRLRVAQGDGGKVRISGTIINLLSKKAQLRPFLVRFLDQNKQVLLERTIEIDQKSLKGEDSLQIYFDVDVPANVEEKATHIKLSLPSLTDENMEKTH